ncbi:LptF/LptG family permease [Rickettsia endosymbiont of Nabis limbatus]|uniref:LptF/LptG family permease n=1 Tax=Rickettsia endosymbiont of Nabis limbatus TaxID=3066268 RepID=UPI003AF3316C
MLLYRKYFIKNILPLLIVITFSMTSLVWITQVLKLLYLFDKGIKVMDFLSLIILVLPTLLFILLPIITVITIIYIYNNLKIERQLIILQTSGVGNLQLALPALYVALIVALLAYYISSTIMPLSHINLKSRLSFIKNNYISSMIEEKTFNKITKDITVYIDKKSVGNVMKGVIIFDNRNTDNPSVVFANSGILDIYKNDPIFELSKGSRQEYDINGNITQLTFDSLMIKLQNDNPLISQRTTHNKEANEYYIDELLAPPIDLNPMKKIKLIAEAHQRIIWPLYNFVLPFLALAVFLKYPYSKKTTFMPILFAALSVLIATSAHFTLQNFASKNLAFITACYLNIFFILSIGLYLFTRKRI